MPPPTSRKTASDLDTALGLRVDGQLFTLQPNDLPKRVERELFVESGGLTLAGIMDAFDRRQFAPFMVAALVYLARRQAGERVTYSELEDAIGYDTEAELITPDELVKLEAAGELSLPPASGGS